MATLAISIGVSAGLAVAQYLLTPKIKRPPEDRGKMDDIRIQGSDYGAFIPILRSGKARLAGNVIFSTGVDEYVVTSGGGGGGGKKGGGGQPVTNTYIYKTSVGILVLGNEIADFDRIWDDSSLLINNTPAATGLFEAEDAALTGGANAYSDGTASDGQAVEDLGNGGKATFNVSSVSTPPPPRDIGELATVKTRVAFVYKCTSDKEATITVGGVTEIVFLPDTDDIWSSVTVIADGAASSVVYENASAATANLDYIHVEKFWHSDTEDYPNDIPYKVTGIVNEDLKYPTDLNDPSEYYNQRVDNVKNVGTGTVAMRTSVPDMLIRLYTGTETQLQDPKLVSWLDGRYGPGQGALRASAHRGHTYFVLQDYTMKNNTLGNFTIEADKGTNTLNEALESYFADVGIGSELYDLTATDGKTQYGILETSPRSRRERIMELERYHGFRIGEIDGKIRTILDDPTVEPLHPAPELVPHQEDLRAHMFGDEMPDHDVNTTYGEEHLLPLKVVGHFMDPDLEYHNNSVRGQLHSNMVATGTVDYSFPVIDTKTNARDRVEKLLLKHWNEKDTHEFVAMPWMHRFSIGDIIPIPIAGTGVQMRVEKKTMPLPMGPVTFQCKQVGPFVPTYIQSDVTGFASKATPQFAASKFPRNSVVFIIESNPIWRRDEGKLGCYLAVCGRGRGDGEKISLYRETDADNFVLQRHLDAPSVLGLCEDTLGDHAGGTDTIDSTNTIDIWFFDNVSLESITDADITRRPQNNLFRIGNEWVQAKTCTAQTLEDNSPFRSKWRLSNLWRGRFGTSAAIATHAADEYAAMADPNLLWYDLEIEDVAETVTFKAVTEGQAIDVAPTSAFTFGAELAVRAVAGEGLKARQLVNLYNDSGTLKCRKANAGDNTKPCDGYVMKAVSAGGIVEVHTLRGSIINGLSGLTFPADLFLGTGASQFVTTAPSASGNIRQKVARSISANAAVFLAEPWVEKA